MNARALPFAYTKYCVVFLTIFILSLDGGVVEINSSCIVFVKRSAGTTFIRRGEKLVFSRNLVASADSPAYFNGFRGIFNETSVLAEKLPYRKL